MARYSGFGLDYTFTASGDMGSYQYRFVRCASTGNPAKIELATGGSEPVAIGVLQNDPYSGGLANVRLYGVTKVYFSGSAAVSVGNLMTSGSTGCAEVVNSDGSAFYGIALEDMLAGTGYISMLLLPNVTIISGTT